MYLGALTNLSDADLDTAYDSAYNDLQTFKTRKGKVDASVRMNDAHQEIVSREQSASTFMRSLFPLSSRFPKFDRIQKILPQGFVASDVSRQAVAESAQRLPDTLATAAGNIFTYGKIVLPVALGIGLFLIYLKVKGK